MICPNCKKEVSDSLSYCPYCGTPLKKEVQTSFVEPEIVDPVSTKHFSPKNFGKATILAIALGVVALVSIFFLSNLFSNPQWNAGSITYLDNKKLTIIGLTGTIALSSTLIAAIPGDSTTPIANQLSALTGWLMIISVIVVSEKYILTFAPYLVFTFLVPAACVLFIFYLYTHRKLLFSLAAKVCIISVVFLMLVPTSVQVSKVIESTNMAEITETMEAANKEETELQKDDQDLFSSITSAVGSLTNDVTETLKTTLSNFIDAVVVLVVTTCLIPLLVFLAFIGSVKYIFGIETNFSLKGTANNLGNKTQGMNKRIHQRRRDEDED